LVMTLVVALAALGRRILGRARLARIEVRERLAEIVLDHLELRDLIADLPLLLLKQRVDPRGRLGRRLRALEVLHEALDLGEREADRLELHDPVDAIDGLRTVEPEPALRARAWLEQPELFVEVHRANGLADRLR